MRRARRPPAGPPGSCERGGAHVGPRPRAAAVSLVVYLSRGQRSFRRGRPSRAAGAAAGRERRCGRRRPRTPRILGPGTVAAGSPSAARLGGRRRLASSGPPEPGGDHVREAPSVLHDRARHQRCGARRGERPSPGDGSGTRGAGMEAAAGGAAGHGEDRAVVPASPVTAGRVPRGKWVERPLPPATPEASRRFLLTPFTSLLSGDTVWGV